MEINKNSWNNPKNDNKNRKLTKLGHVCLYFARKRPNIMCFCQPLLRKYKRVPSRNQLIRLHTGLKNTNDTCM